jgi:SseB protein N-terminal domain
VTGPFVPDPGFAGDDGAAEPALVAALGSGDVAAVQEALLGARVFAPLVALLGESEVGHGGLRVDKTSDVGVVTVQRSDGARALPVFSSTAALAAWNPMARPRPVHGPRVALATYAEGAIALLVDPGDPRSAVLFGPLLLALAEGRRWLPAVEDPDIADELRAQVPAGVGWRLQSASVADATLVLTFPAGTPPDVAGSSAAALATVLADLRLFRARLSNGFDVVAEVSDS